MKAMTARTTAFLPLPSLFQNSPDRTFLQSSQLPLISPQPTPPSCPGPFPPAPRSIHPHQPPPNKNLPSNFTPPPYPSHPIRSPRKPHQRTTYLSAPFKFQPRTSCIVHLALADLFVNRTRNATVWPSVSSSPSHPLLPNLEARVCDEAGAVRAICGKRCWGRGRCG